MAWEENNGIDLDNSKESQSLPLPLSFLESPLAGRTDKPLGSTSSSIGTQPASWSACGDSALQKSKSSRRPQLPSFKGLGILALELPSTPNNSACASYHTIPTTGIVEYPFSSLDATASAHRQSQRTGSTPLLTPPADLDALRWIAIPSPCQSSTASKSDAIVAIPTIAHTSATECAQGSDGNAQAEEAPFEPPGTNGNELNQESENNDRSQSSAGSNGSTSWLDRAVGAAVISIDPSNPSSNSIQMVSQTLPNPVAETAKPIPIFNEIIAAIQTRFGANRQPYITVTHAVPPRFDLLYLPSSPPATPNLFVGRDDYFTQSIFVHAAVVPSYHGANNSLATPAVSSPNPIVPPSSVQVSVLERYLPPATSQEGKDLFSLSGQSVLIDRLAELSPARGTMLFVYPTKTGASAFASKYLSQILDPLLRALVEVHQLSYSLAESLGSMAAIADMHEFQALQDKMTSLCRRMSNRITSDANRSTFNLVYASKGEVSIDRATWTGWFLKQEHNRFKRTLENYWGRGRRLSQLDSASAGSVLREFIDGVNKMTDDEAEQTGPGIEIGVFVVRRTLAASAS